MAIEDKKFLFEICKICNFCTFTLVQNSGGGEVWQGERKEICLKFNQTGKLIFTLINGKRVALESR